MPLGAPVVPEENMTTKGVENSTLSNSSLAPVARPRNVSKEMLFAEVSVLGPPGYRHCFPYPTFDVEAPPMTTSSQSLLPNCLKARSTLSLMSILFPLYEYTVSAIKNRGSSTLRRSSSALSPMSVANEENIAPSAPVAKSRARDRILLLPTTAQRFSGGPNRGSWVKWRKGTHAKQPRPHAVQMLSKHWHTAPRALPDLATNRSPGSTCCLLVC